MARGLGLGPSLQGTRGPGPGAVALCRAPAKRAQHDRLGLGSSGVSGIRPWAIGSRGPTAGVPGSRSGATSPALAPGKQRPSGIVLGGRGGLARPPRGPRPGNVRDPQTLAHHPYAVRRAPPYHRDSAASRAKVSASASRPKGGFGPHVCVCVCRLRRAVGHKMCRFLHLKHISEARSFLASLSFRGGRLVHWNCFFDVESIVCFSHLVSFLRFQAQI